MDCLLNPVDFAAAGLAFDISGALILVRGLLPTSAQMVRRARTILEFRLGETIMGPHVNRFTIDNPALFLAQVEDKVDGGVGVTALTFGFVLQAVAVVLAAAGKTGAIGTEAAFFAFGITVGTTLIALGCYRLFRNWLVRRRLASTFRDQPDLVRLRNACERLLEHPDEAPEALVEESRYVPGRG